MTSSGPIPATQARSMRIYWKWMVFQSRCHEQGSRCHPLREEAKERNKVRSSVRARVEQVFGAITTSMRGKLTRRIGLARTKAWWGLLNLTYNFLRYQHCSSRTVLAA
ncbi:transposase [Hyphomonas sp.]|uniref:transposase n=1 Tax=Hyphomonas sp. TaxID=87 RepID=UPI0037BF1103